MYSDRIEYSQPERPNIPNSVVRIQNITLSPIIRHHGHFEFTMFSSELGYLQRVRIRAHELSETERIHSIIQRVKMLSSTPLKPASRYTIERQHSELKANARLSHSGLPRTNTVHGLPEMSIPGAHHFLMFPRTSPHFSVNLVVVLLVGLTTLVAPVLNSLLLTMSVVLLVALTATVIMNYYAIDVPTLHLIVTSSPQFFPAQQTASFFDARASMSQPVESEGMMREVEGEEEQGSGASSINELGYSTPIPGSPEQHSASFDSIPGKGISVLFSESSKFMASFASAGDHRMCYSIMWSISDAVISLLRTQPGGVAPPEDLKMVPPQGVEIDYSVKIVPDDAEFTKSEWSTIRNKNGITVLTSKLSSAITKWPVISAVSTITARLDDVYKAISIPEIYKKVDEFVGTYRIIEYNELASGSGGTLEESAISNSPSATAFSQSKESTDEEITVDLLRPETAPLLFKHQEMKSVWPVQPRDYFALSTGITLSLADGRRGKFFVSKSSDPHPKDPFPTGHEGFIRGALTSSCFLLIENAANPTTATDVWTFLHCDMKGNLSGNGKIADFITQSQMPKFLARLEAVSSSCAPEMGLVK